MCNSLVNGETDFVKTQFAKAILKNAGYYTDSLWQIDDVQSKYNCTDEEAQYCLQQSLTNEGTMNQVWLSVDIFAEMQNLEKVLFDKKGNRLEKGDFVDVDEPESTDETYSFGFNGIINDFKDGYVVVEDAEGDCFSVESNKLEKENE